VAAEAPPAAASAAVQAQPVALPAGAVEVGLTGTLKVTPPGVTFLRDVATVRAAGPDAGATTTAATFVVDFGVPLTVSAIWFPPSSSTSGPNTVTAASLWLGTQFVPISPGGPDGGFPVDQNSMASLGELQTQKLQVSLAQELDPADAQSQGLVNLPAAPASVQISLNGVPAWRSPPGAPPLPGAPAEVDLSAALAAVAAAAAGPVSVTVTVSAPSPLQEPALSLNAPTYLLEFAALPSPQVPALELDAPQEGAYQLTLPLPGAAATWPVREVLLTLAGRPPATRVLEPTLPVLAQTAFLGLQPGTTLAAALPAAWLAKLQTLTALRIPLSVTASGDPAGIELAPVLYSRDGPAGPLSPLPGANLAAVTVPAADGGDAPQWVALQLAEPLPVVPGQQLWLALGVVRGSATWLTAAPGPAAGPDAPLGRLTSSGAFLGLSRVANLAGPFAAIRLVGVPLDAAACPALAVGVHPAAATGLADVTPTSTGTTVRTRLAAPATPSAAAGGSAALPLDVVVAAPGRYTLQAAAVRYPPPGGGP
jgi:hypothetical protein